MTYLEIIEIALLLAACYACLHKGIDIGVSMCLDKLLEDGLIDREKFNRFTRSLPKE